MTFGPHYYDDLVLSDNSAITDYWRLDNDGGKNRLANLKRDGITASCGISATNILPGTLSNNNGSLSFNGTSDYVTATYLQLSQGNTFPSSNSLAVEAWIYPTADQSATDVIGIAHKLGSFGLYLTYGKPTFYVQANGGSRIPAVSATAVSVSTSYHLVGTYQATTGNLYLYVNGSQVATTNTGSTGQANDHNNNNFVIGSWDTSTLFFNGMITNVALYDGYLSSTYANSHYTWS